MPELVKIPAATAEVVGWFDRPYIGLLVTDKTKAFESVVTALLPFNFRLKNTEIFSSGKPAEERVIFKIPERGITFQFGAEKYGFTKDGASWSGAAEDGAVLNAAQTALLLASGAKVGAIAMTLAMHIIPLSKTREEVIAPFIPGPFKHLILDQQSKAFGAHMRFTDGDEVLFDHSLSYANGIFMRLSADFDGEMPTHEIFATMRNKEERVFRLFDIQDATGANE